MRSPVLAMLWENWRLTRVEAAQRLAQGIVVGSAALTLAHSTDRTHGVSRSILSSMHACSLWFSIAKLNGGRFMDGYKPGFPLYLLYTRPVPTVTFVGVAMAYDAVSAVVVYLVSAALLRFAFGQPLPLFSVAVCLVAYHFAHSCVQWSTRNRVVQWIGSMAPSCRSSLCSGSRAGVAAAGRVLARRERTDGPGWRRVVRPHGRRGGAAAPRRRAGSHAPGRWHGADSRTGSPACSGSRVPPRPRRGRRCGST